MEKLMQRENRGYGEEDESCDFNDVFGGPPRRFSMQEMRDRCSFGSEVSSLKEKPVFGEESSMPRRRRHSNKGSGDDFFDDIFKGSRESSYSSPRKTQDVFGSSPAGGSRIMSPARPLPPKADDYDDALPLQLSLLAKSMKAMELPTFASHKVDEITINGLNSPHSSSPLSRFSNRGQDEIRNEFHRRSPLSYEASFITTDDSSLPVAFHQKDNIENFNKDMRNVDSDGNQFHFSIYKWAGGGVPMVMPLISGNSFRSKDKRKKYDRYPSSNGRMDDSKLSIFARKEQLEEEVRSKEVTEEMQNSVAEVVSEFRELKPHRSLNDTVALSSGRPTKKDERDVRDDAKKEATVKIRESLLESKVKKPPFAFLHGGEQQQQQRETEDKRTRTSGVVHADHAHDSENVEEKEGTEVDSKNVEVKKSSSRGVTINLGGVTQGRSVAKGKVKEFVQIFNQESDVLQTSRSSKWRNIGVEQNENEESSNAAKAEKHVNMDNVDKKPDVSFIKVDVKLNNNDEAQKNSTVKTPSYTSNSSSSSSDPQKTFSSETLHNDTKSTPEEIPDDPLEDNFLVQELSDVYENETQSESSEDTKVIDAKIRQWSFGKKGNIRSLLSTLQYVLWPESGWKAVPLVDLIESNSVKRAYQKALLRLHPDKLQQKGAAFHHKYIAEKVFDILQEAWDHFNTCSLTV